MTAIDDIHVRVGIPDDVHSMMDLALSACSENGFLNPDPEKLLQDIWPSLNRDRGIVGIIGAPKEKIEGAILLRVGELWYSRDNTLEERAVFIAPEYRSAKGGRARKLVEFAKKTADALVLPLTIGVLSNHRTEGKVRLYKRMFGEPAGAYFLYGAQTGSMKEAAA